MQGGLKMKEFTIKEAAEYYGKSESWIRKKILAEELQAEKRPFQYGERWIITDQALDDLADRLNQTAKAEQEVVEVRQVDKPVNADELVNRLNKASKELIESKSDEIKKVINDQNKKIDQQTELIKKLSDQVEKMKDQQNKTFIDKLKDFFK